MSAEGFLLRMLGRDTGEYDSGTLLTRFLQIRIPAAPLASVEQGNHRDLAVGRHETYSGVHNY